MQIIILAAGTEAAGGGKLGKSGKTGKIRGEGMGQMVDSDCRRTCHGLVHVSLRHISHKYRTQRTYWCA